jgi:glutathione peroxidase
MTNIYNFSIDLLDGTNLNFNDLRGKTLILANTASKCGYTPQYNDLQKLYEKYKDKGLVIIGFPCGQFGGQEFGTSDEIQSFCSLNYGVTFPITKKIKVNGKDANPIFEYLKDNLTGLLGIKDIKWNFTKFLIDKDGNPVKRFAPADQVSEIEKELINIL